MAARKDHYRVLSIPPIASLEDIHKAYRKLSKEWHPDLNADRREVATERMKELVDAYSVLNDVQKRKEYDNQPHFRIRRSLVEKGKKRPVVKAEGPSLISRIGAMFSAGSTRTPTKAAADPRKKSEEHFSMALSMVDYASFLGGAKNEFKLSASLDPGYKDAFYNLGIVCYRLGEFDEAINALQKVLTIDGSDKEAGILIKLLRDYEY